MKTILLILLMLCIMGCETKKPLPIKHEFHLRMNHRGNDMWDISFTRDSFHTTAHLLESGYYRYNKEVYKHEYISIGKEEAMSVCEKLKSYNDCLLWNIEQERKYYTMLSDTVNYPTGQIIEPKEIICK